MLDNTPNQPTKLRTKIWIEINDDSRGTYNTNSQIKFKASMLRSSLRGYSYAYILVSGTITITGLGADDAAKWLDERNKEEKVKWRKKNTQIDNAKYIDFAMPMYNLIEYSDNYSKTSRSLWQYYRDDTNDNINNLNHLNSRLK